MWNVKLKRLNIQPKTGLKALGECSELIYPNLSKLFKIFCTLKILIKFNNLKNTVRWVSYTSIQQMY